MNFSRPVSEYAILGAAFVNLINTRAIDRVRELISEVMNETTERHAKGARDASVRGID